MFKWLGIHFSGYGHGLLELGKSQSAVPAHAFKYGAQDTVVVVAIQSFI